MSQEHSTISDAPSGQTPVQTPGDVAHEPVDDERERRLEEPTGPELPRRPRRRLLGAGANPLPLALIGVLLTACGFIGGVLVQKAQSPPSGSTSASGLASRFAAPRSGTSGAATARSGASGSGAGAFLGGAGGAGATFGEVAYVAGHTLYVTGAQGNTVKVTTSAASTVTKTVKADVKAIHPGETVIVTGTTGANGAVSAETIRVSEAGAAGGGLGALFGGAGGGFAAARGGTSEGATRGGGGEQALFGK
ncbi:MAG TPA: hypothetical protein VIG42_08680 [Solirubrobacteraceae bacterium]